MNRSITIVKDQGSAAGRVVYWWLSGPVEHGKLAKAWKERGLDEDLLPYPPTPERALKRALNEYSDNRTLVRPLADRGYAIVLEEAVGKGLKHEIDMIATLTSIVNSETEEGEIEELIDIECEPKDHPKADFVRDRWIEEMHQMNSTDISDWLSRYIMPAVGAASLRDKGGVYFIPRKYIPLWQKVCSVLEEVSSHKLHQIPAMATQEAVEAILDAVTTEATKAVNKLADDIDDIDKLGKRALKTRVGKCQALAEKLQSYDDLLGRKLDEIRARVDDAKVCFAAAALAATGEEQ